MRTRTIIQLSAMFSAFGFLFAPAAAQVPLELEVDLLELHIGAGDDHLLLDSTLTLGRDDDQLLAKFAGGSDTRTGFDDLEVQALYSRSLSEKVALHLGVRHDMRSGSDLTFGVAGLVVELLRGLEAEHYFFVSQHGDLTGGGQILLDAEITPRLVLEPRITIGWSAQYIPAEALGNGLTDLDASLRLRRSLGESFDVYAGVVHERLLATTRSIAVAAGDPARVTRAVVGFGFSF